MKCFNKLWHLFVMLCYIYCSLATAYAETMRSVKQECSTSQFSQGCVLCPRVLPSSFFKGSLARLVSTRMQVRSLRSWNWETAREFRSGCHCHERTRSRRHWLRRFCSGSCHLGRSWSRHCFLKRLCSGSRHLGRSWSRHHCLERFCRGSRHLGSWIGSRHLGRSWSRHHCLERFCRGSRHLGRSWSRHHHLERFCSGSRHLGSWRGRRCLRRSWTGANLGSDLWTGAGSVSDS